MNLLSNLPFRVSKFYAFLLLIAVCLILLMTVLLISSKRKQYELEQDYREKLEKAQQEKVYWKDEAGRTHLRLEKVQASLDEAINHPLVDAVTKIVKVPAKRIADITSVGTSTTGEGTVVVKTDTVTKLREIDYRDDWMHITTTVDSTDNALVRYKGRDSLILASYTKGFLKKRTYLDAFSLNPNTTVTGLQNIDLSKYVKPKRLGVGIQAGYYFDFKTRRFIRTIGAGVSYNFIRL